MTADDLAALVVDLRSFGTDVADVEAKRARDALPRSVRETLSAFANTAGGVIVLGLDEERGYAATGVAEPKRVAEALSSLAAEEMEPRLKPLIGLHRFEDVVLITAEVPALDPAHRPCYYKGAGMTRGSFVRVGDSDRQLSSYEVQMLLASRGQPRDDEEPIPQASVEALDPDAVDRFCRRMRATKPRFAELDDLSVLRRSRVLVPAPSGGECLTLAGLLTLGAFPQQYFPQLNLTFIHYPTPAGAALSSGERFLDNASIDGSIPAIVRDALVTLHRNMTRRAVVIGAGRQDIWEYPEVALREALVNALVHRDLSPLSRGMQVQVDMYPDRLRIMNAGGLFGPVTLGQLGEQGVVSSRNALLMRILEDVVVPHEWHTVCESRGSGILTMVRALRESGMRPPVFEDRISTFSVTFPNHTLMSDRVMRWIAALGETSLTGSQILGLAMVADGEILDNARYRVATGLDSRVATAELQDLVARELLVQAGERRWAKYVLSKRAAGVDPDAGDVRFRTPTPRADRRAEILAAFGEHPLSRSDLAELTGLGDKTVGRWLTILRREGAVEVTTGSPRSRHARYRRLPQPEQGHLFSC